ncbi:MAG: glycosyltransferase [Bacteroidales bacterium]|nr:glycosyltransferase [Bacteroidales bacterium]
MKLFVITPIYATTTEGNGTTPLVHYFAREWVKMGHDVTVFHVQARFPRPFYWVGKLFQHRLNTRFGFLVPTSCPKDEDYVAEGVTVHSRTITKYKPHSTVSGANRDRIVKIICREIEKNGVPDHFIGHWESPNLEVLPALKKIFNRPVALVLHTNGFDFEKRYGKGIMDTIREIDTIGFRSNAARKSFEGMYFAPRKSFICCSGVSEAFLKAGEDVVRDFTEPAGRFIFTGSLIARKHPECVYDALCKACPQGDFSVKYIGDGAEESTIRQRREAEGLGRVEFTGRIPREEVIGHLRQADVFAMISEVEIFGLVYIEAMALGVIPIGSRNEGIDGIIIDGKNGFLCEAGNTEELSGIIEKIRGMDRTELRRISDEARRTALEFSDMNVARKYLESIAIQ